MLVEIYCEKFLQKQIKFNDGLNVVLGGSKADNSVGKSTLLLIVDYCFGGDTYCKKQDSDIIKNIGNHIIHFVFKFDNKLYPFARDTSKPNIVFKCDKNGQISEEMQLKEFNAFLNQHYFQNNLDFSFREKVGRFLRIAGKGNMHDDKPLRSFDGDSDSQGINVLEELFGYYKELKGIKDQLKSLRDEKKARESAKKFNIIPSEIRNKSDYKNALAKRDTLNTEKQEIFRKGNVRHFEGDAVFSKEAIDLKIQLENLLKNQSRLNYRKKKLDKSISEHASINESELKELQSFFPNINMKKLYEINEFHNGIIAIITNEIKAELLIIDRDLKNLAQKIEPIEKELTNLNIPNCISPDMMKEISQKEVEIISASSSIDNYEKDQNIKSSIKGIKIKLAELESTITASIDNSINNEMEEISNKVNKEKRFSPRLKIINNDKYKFETPNDTGTGSKYKNVIIFDLSILRLSSLPLLIHDSIVFKNIGDDPLNNIFKQYLLCNKQIFISIDKIEDYHNDETLNILKSRSIIKLDDGHELFGRSWGKSI